MKYIQFFSDVLYYIKIKTARKKCRIAVVSAIQEGKEIRNWKKYSNEMWFRSMVWHWKE